MTVCLTGLFWFLMGAWLLAKGLKFSSGAVPLISTAFLAGYFKGKYVLSKSARRLTARIYALPLPISFWKVYPLSYWLLIGSMMALGLLLNLLSLPLAVRGWVDIAIGVALIRGSFIYGRAILLRSRESDRAAPPVGDGSPGA